MKSVALTSPPMITTATSFERQVPSLCRVFSSRFSTKFRKPAGRDHGLSVLSRMDPILGDVFGPHFHPAVRYERAR